MLDSNNVIFENLKLTNIITEDVHKFLLENLT